jgi:hypothetical protein
LLPFLLPFIFFASFRFHIFFLLCFASIFFVSLQSTEIRGCFPFILLQNIFFTYFALLFLFAFLFRFVSLFLLRSASFPFRFACKIYVLLQRETSQTNPSVSLQSEINFAFVSISFALNRKQTAHPSRVDYRHELPRMADRAGSWRRPVQARIVLAWHTVLVGSKEKMKVCKV